MRKLWAWGLTAALFVALTVSSGWARDDDEDDNTPTKPPPRPTIRWSRYFANMNASTPLKPEPKKPEGKQKKDSAKKPVENSKPLTVADRTAAERAREEMVLMRRLEACDKLKEIALQRNDSDLFRRAEVLDERARTTYAQRTAYLRGGKSGFESDEKTVDNYLGPAYPLKTRSPESTAHTVSGTDQASRAALKEVNP